MVKAINLWYNKHGKRKYMAKYKKNQIVTGCVTGIENYGVFVSLDEYYSGLIHISEISDNFVRNIEDYVKLGESIKAKVIDVDDDTFHVKLSIKNLDYNVARKRKNKIKETELGFSTLESKLDRWIEEKYAEIISSNQE